MEEKVTAPLAPAERERAFRADFAALLQKHRADLRVTDDGRPWGLHIGVAIVTMDAQRDYRGDVYAEYTEFNL